MLTHDQLMKNKIIPGFTWSFFWCCLRYDFFLKILLGVFLGSLMSISDWFSGCNSTQIYILNFAGCVVCSYLIWSGSAFIGEITDFRLNWEIEGLKKAILLLALNVVYISICLLLVMKSLEWVKGSDYPSYVYWESFIYGIFVTTVINLVYISKSIFSFWKHTKYENEVLKQENLKSQLESLKNQVNPHFLFNSLNTLISIIDDEPETAKNYTQNLSQVYRYILQAKEKDLVSLKEELEFTKAYDYLLKIRYGDNLHFQLDIPTEYLHFKTPTLVLQMLVENAIKHNVISQSKPLTIRIFVDEMNILIVSNNYQPKKLNIESDKVGLKNIADRFRILEGKEIEVIQNEAYFRVKLPLIV